MVFDNFSHDRLEPGGPWLIAAPREAEGRLGETYRQEDAAIKTRGEWTSPWWGTLGRGDPSLKSWGSPQDHLCVYRKREISSKIWYLILGHLSLSLSPHQTSEAAGKFWLHSQTCLDIGAGYPTQCTYTLHKMMILPTIQGIPDLRRCLHLIYTYLTSIGSSHSDQTSCRSFCIISLDGKT